MVPALQFTYWQWISLTLAAPVVAWGAWPFHRAALGQPAPRRRDDGHPGVDGRARGVRVVAVGAAVRHRRRARHDAPVRADHRPERRRRRTSTSRSPPASPRSSSPAATSRPGPSAAPGRRCGRCSSSAPRTSPCSADGREVRIPIGQLAVGDRFVVRPGREDRHRRRRRGRLLRGRRVDAHRRVRPGRGRPRRRRRRGDGQRRRAARRARHPRRRRHPARADGEARRGRAERQGRGPAPRRPDLRGVRADRHRAGRGHPRVLARHRRRARPRRSPPPSPC